MKIFSLNYYLKIIQNNYDINLEKNLEVKDIELMNIVRLMEEEVNWV